MRTICGWLTLLVLVAAAQVAAANDLTPMEQLGKELFFDKISSPSSMSCASCHTPDVGWVGGVAGINLHGAVYPGAVRQRFGNRKPPSSAYATFNPIFHYDDVADEFTGGTFWDGRATGEVLGSPAADQAGGPFLNPVEQNMPSKQSVCENIASSRYADLFEEVWGPGSLDCSELGVAAMYDQIALSIAAYEGSPEVSPFSSKFDAYWQACVDAGNDPEACGLAEGDKAVLDPTGIFSQQEFDGLIEFGEYCAPCHVSHEFGPGGVPPLFTDFTFDNIGVPRNPENPFYDMDEVYLPDGSPINPLGDNFVDFGLGDFLRTRPEWEAMAPVNDGKFKIPTLRNVDRRRNRSQRQGMPNNAHGVPKAYMHNGVFKTLAGVVHFYNTRDVPTENWPEPEVSENVNRDLLEGVPLGNLELDAAAETAIVAFLGTLSDGFFVPAGARPDGAGRGVVASARLGLATPNPLNPVTQIRFTVLREAPVKLTVYDAAGRSVAVLIDAIVSRGNHSVPWDGRDAIGRRAPSGIYFYRLESVGVAETRKIALVN